MKNSLPFYLMLLFFFGVSINTTKANNTILEEIKSIKEVKNVYELKSNFFKHFYEVEFEQPLDHKNENSKTFLQHIYVGINNESEPTVLQTAGYQIHSPSPAELSRLLQCNQISVEHRYFNKSVPDSIDWNYLNTYQAASDLHQIFEAFKKILPAKWLSTGISKGGQTSIYYKYYYPNDMDVVAPYVAPLNMNREDPRINDFLNNKVGNKNDRKKIKRFIHHMLKNEAFYLPYFKDRIEAENLHFSKLGLRKAYELCVLEFKFAFWQWGAVSINKFNKAPRIDKNNIKLLCDVSGPHFFSDEGVADLQPFFVQAMEELGMYDYDTVGLGKYLDKNLIPTFSFTIPKQQMINFNENLNKKVRLFLDSNSENMLFVGGEYDPWHATAYTPPSSSNAINIVIASGCHTSRLSSLPKQERDSVIRVLKEWLK